MKARVKATGEIGIVVNIDILFGCKEYRPYHSDEVEIIDSYAEVDADNEGFDYWTRLEHQYAGMAMQGIIARHNVDFDMVVEWSADLAHALVQKMKEVK